jgi:periplasmic mercuric ion binding protein
MKNNFTIRILLFVSLLCISANLLAQTAEVKIKTSAVCDMCKRAIERDLAFEKGIKKVALDLDSNVVTVLYNTKKTDEQKIRTALTLIGYDADSLIADSVAYLKLPECCKKDKGRH